VNDRPTSVELLRAVERFLQNDAVPSLSGPRRYHARVAANVVAIVAREIETEENHLRGEWERLGRLLDLDEAPPGEREARRAGVVARTEALVQRIRSGDGDSGPWRDSLLAHLRQTVLDKLDVARPPRAG
jgi:hypothetical protein